MTRSLSDSQLDAIAAGTLTCPTCKGKYLQESPHRHETPPRPDYDPMPPRPGTLAGMIALVRREYQAEIPSRLHVRYVTSDEQLGVDAGSLGSPSWDPAFARRVGGVRLDDVEPGEWAIFPWAFAIERRLEPWCRRYHRPPLWTEHRSPICKPLVLAVVRDRSVTDAADQVGVTPERAELLLEQALGRVFGWVSNVLNDLDVGRAA